MIPAPKRSRSAKPPPSKSSIDNLPDAVLIEILCRLPYKKVVFRCKLVSKRWRNLLSDPYFVKRFLCIQHDQQNPLIHQHVMIPYKFAKQRTLVLTMSSMPSPPLLEAPITSILSYLPCFQGHVYAKKDDFHVEGTYKDLILCSPTLTAQRDYYICNSYTKEWIRLPPIRPRHSDRVVVSVGFICDPYYNIKEDDTGSSNAIIKLNSEYRCKVVRLLPDKDYKVFDVEIYSSETGEWREYSSSKILCQQEQRRRYRFPYMTRTGVACNGKLYWLFDKGSIVELDPFNICSTDDVIDKCCRLIDPPTPSSLWHIGVCRGQLRMCPIDPDPMIIWELKESLDGKPKWCLIFDEVCLSEMVRKQRKIKTLMMKTVGFHPVHGDIVYLVHSDVFSEEPRYIVMCNVRERTLEIARKIPFEKTPVYAWNDRQIFPYVIPWWPTPVPTRLNYREDYLNITLIGVDTFTIKVGCLSSVKQLKQELEQKKGPGQYELYFDGLVLEDDDKWLTDYGIKDKSKIYFGEYNQ